LPPLTKNFFTVAKKNIGEECDIKQENMNIVNFSKLNQLKLIPMPKMREAS
jgi:hypothetical protein